MINITAAVHRVHKIILAIGYPFHLVGLIIELVNKTPMALLPAESDGHPYYDLPCASLLF